MLHPGGVPRSDATASARGGDQAEGLAMLPRSSRSQSLRFGATTLDLVPIAALGRPCPDDIKTARSNREYT